MSDRILISVLQNNIMELMAENKRYRAALQEIGFHPYRKNLDIEWYEEIAQAALKDKE